VCLLGGRRRFRFSIRFGRSRIPSQPCRRGEYSAGANQRTELAFNLTPTCRRSNRYSASKNGYSGSKTDRAAANSSRRESGKPSRNGMRGTPATSRAGTATGARPSATSRARTPAAGPTRTPATSRARSQQQANKNASESRARNGNRNKIASSIGLSRNACRNKNVKRRSSDRASKAQEREHSRAATPEAETRKQRAETNCVKNRPKENQAQRPDGGPYAPPGELDPLVIDRDSSRSSAEETAPTNNPPYSREPSCFGDPIPKPPGRGNPPSLRNRRQNLR